MIGAFPRVVSIQSPFLRIYLTRFRQDYAAMNETIGVISRKVACRPAPASA